MLLWPDGRARQGTMVLRRHVLASRRVTKLALPLKEHQTESKFEIDQDELSSRSLGNEYIMGTP